MTNLVTRSAMRPSFEFAYNLFRDPQRPAIYCAVPEHYPVPRFLDGWTFEGSLRSPVALPPGFHARAAGVGVHCNGFYLFQITAEPQQRKTVVAPQARLNDNGIRLAEVG
jgi:hypothetical protein